MIPHLLIIGPVPPPKGGVSIHVQRLSTALTDRGVRHEIIDESRLPSEGVANLRRMSLWSYLLTMRRARLVHIHSSNPLVRLAHTIVARLHGNRIVQTVHSLDGSSTGSIALGFASKLSHSSIGVNATISQSLGSRAVTLPAFIPPTSEEENLDREIETWLSAQKADGREVIAMNAFRAEIMDGADLYGLDMAVEAFRESRVRDRFSLILCVSSTQHSERYHAEIERRIAELGVGDRLKIVLGQSNFPAVLRRCDVFVRPTITDGDAISVREALWYGKPVIASDAVIRPSGTILFRSRDVGQLVDRILSVASANPPIGERRDFADDVIRIYEAVATRS